MDLTRPERLGAWTFRAAWAAHTGTLLPPPREDARG
jgi:hypothetical protein